MKRLATYDVVLIGGGVASAAAAISLRQQGYSAVVLDKPRQSISFGETLPAASIEILERLNVAQRFLDDKHLPCFSTLSSWGSDTPVENHSILNPYGNGWLINRFRFETMLREATASLNVEWLNLQSTPQVKRTADSWTIADGEHGVVQAKFLINATGRSSQLTHQLCPTRLRFDKQVALIGTLKAETSLPSTMLIEAVEDGWWYFAPQPRQRGVLIYMTDGDLLKKSNHRSSEGFSNLLANTSLISPWTIDHSLHLTEKPNSVVAQTSSLQSPSGKSWVCVGDAAATFDPLGSIGISAALVSGIHAADAFTQLENGDEEAVEDYGETILSVHESHRITRSKYYQMEKRWPLSPFWKRRHVSPDYVSQNLERSKDSRYENVAII